MNTHWQWLLTWNWLRKPSGLRRSCKPSLGMSALNIACGVPWSKGMASSRKRARPSVSVKSTVRVKWFMDCIIKSAGYNLPSFHSLWIYTMTRCNTARTLP